MTALQRAVARQWLRGAVRASDDLDGYALATAAVRSMGLRGPDDWSELAEMAGLLCEHEQARREREARHEGLIDGIVVVSVGVLGYGTIHALAYAASWGWL